MSGTKPKIVAFHPSPAHRVPDDKAEPYGRELLRIERDCGGLDNETIVEQASRKSSPIHDAFTWDESKAARKCRLYEAGELRRAIEVDVRMPDGSIIEGMPLTTVITIKVVNGSGNPKTERRSESICVVLGDPEKCKSAVAECKRDFIDLRHRWETMKVAEDKMLDAVLRAVDAMEQSLSTEEPG